VTTSFIKGLLSAALAAVAIAAPAQGSTADGDALTVARQQLDAGNPLGTLAALDADAAPPGFQQQFLRGVAWQELALSSSQSSQAPAWWAKARQAYDQALTFRPQSSAVFTNLALLASAQGDKADARQWYQKAADGPEARGGLYALNYARFLDSQGDVASAIDYATRAWKAAPTGSAARQTLASLYVKAPGDERLPAFLAAQLADGETLFVLSTALDALQSANPRPRPQRISLLVIVAASISRDPVQLAKSPEDRLYRRLLALEEDPEIGAAARQLGQVLWKAPDSPQGISQWSSDTPRLAARPPLTPRSEMRHLLQGLAAQQGSRDAKRAEGWLRLAVEIGDRGPDPDAFLQLVGWLANTNRLAELPPLMERYQWELFSEKSSAYARGDWPEIFRLHLALGMTYAQMKVWTSAEPYQNAIFQLEHARLAAEHGGGTGADRLVLPPAATLQLAQGYQATGNAKRATLVKLDAAARLQQAERPVERNDVLTAIRPGELDGMDEAVKQQYKALARDSDKPY
jgi:hypothetical protein